VTRPSQPWAIASGRNAPLDMAIDANDVYWTENNTGGVYQVGKSGGSVVTIKAADNVVNSSWAVATDSTGGGTLVFWADRAHGRVGAAPVGGGATPWYFDSPNGSGAGTYGIAQDYDKTVDRVFASDFSTGGVWTFGANHSGGTGLVDYSATGPTGLFALGGNNVLVTLYASGSVQNDATMIATGKNDDARYVTSDGTTAFWTASDGNQVWAAPINGNGTTPVLVSGSESQPWGIATDGTSSIYWVNKTSGTVVHGSLSATAGRRR